jgi:hypothetical protein
MRNTAFSPNRWSTAVAACCGCLAALACDCLAQAPETAQARATQAFAAAHGSESGSAGRTAASHSTIRMLSPSAAARRKSEPPSRQDAFALPMNDMNERKAPLAATSMDEESWTSDSFGALLRHASPRGQQPGASSATASARTAQRATTPIAPKSPAASLPPAETAEEPALGILAWLPWLRRSDSADTSAASSLALRSSAATQARTASRPAGAAAATNADRPPTWGEYIGALLGVRAKGQPESSGLPDADGGGQPVRR